jgi:hypothetical protein
MMLLKGTAAKNIIKNYLQFKFYIYQRNICKCSGQKTLDYSSGRLSEALDNWGSGNLEGGGFGESVGTGEVSL